MKNIFKNGYSNKLFLIIAGIIIFLAWLSVASWYLFHKPLLGVDFYNTGTYVSFLLKNFALRYNSWRYIWFGGLPLEGDYPTLYFYFILPFAAFLGTVKGIQIFMLLSLFLFILLSFFIFKEISGNFILSLVLAIGVSYSIGVYGALVWGGSLPYFVSQTFFVAVIYLLVKFLKNRNKKFLLLAALVAGISMFGHPQVNVTYGIAFALIILLFGSSDSLDELKIKERFKNILIYFGTFFLVFYPRFIYKEGGANPIGHIRYFLYTADKFLKTVLSKFLSFFGDITFYKEAYALENPLTKITKGVSSVEEWRKSQLVHFIDWTNPVFFYLLGIILILFVASFIIKPSKKSLFSVLPFFLCLAYVLFYIGIYGFGIDLYQGGWYRAFWTFPLVLGMFIGSMYSNFAKTFAEKFKNSQKLFAGGIVTVNLLFLATGIYPFWKYNSKFTKLFDEEWASISSKSSVFPEILNYSGSRQELKELKSKLVPGWLNPNSQNYRLLESDAQVNIWWNALFDMPLAKGYIDSPSGEEWFFFLTAAVFRHGGDLSQLVDNWKVPAEVALNQALFLLDWNAIKYIEADHASDVNPQISKDLLRADYIKQDEKALFTAAPELIGLNINEKTKNPIIKSVNYPLLLFVGPRDKYDKLYGLLSEGGDYKYLPLWAGETIEIVKKHNLSDYGAVFLSDYSYSEVADNLTEHSEFWKIFEEYVRNGGSLYIEPGADNIDSGTYENYGFYVGTRVQQIYNSETKLYEDVGGSQSPLPQPFPVAYTRRKEIVADVKLLGNISFLKNVSVEITKENNRAKNKISTATELRADAKTLLNFENVPVVVESSLGQGKVIWSGLGLIGERSQSLGSGEFTANLIDYLNPAKLSPPKFSLKDKGLGKEFGLKTEKARGIFISGLGNIQDWAIEEADALNLKTYTPKEGKDSLFYVSFPSLLWFVDSEFVIVDNRIQNLHFYELKDELVSPIVSSTNSPAIGIIGSGSSYEAVVRALSVNNLNTRKLIPVRLETKIDKVSYSDLENMDAVILYGYDYKNRSKSWEILDKYVKNGGKLFIETGSEVKESDSINLPSRFSKTLPNIFPIVKTKREEFGKDWSLKSESLDFDQMIFSAPTIDGNPWKFSIPSDQSDLKPGARVLLENYNNPIIVSWEQGRGKVVWSGMNLFYHVLVHNNLEESKYLTSLISSLVEVKDNPLPIFNSKRVSAEKATISLSNASGILFRERAVTPAWKARLSSKKGSTSLKIYPAGPFYPGFMYVRIPEKYKDLESRVTFTYSGSIGSYLYALATLFVILMITDYSFFNGKFLIARTKPYILRLTKGFGTWWEKDEEY